MLVNVNHLINCSATAPKPENAVHKDPVTAELALGAHILTGDQNFDH